MDISLLDVFEKQQKACEEVQKRLVAAALHMWISLPEDLQARLISKESGKNDFLSLVRQIVDEHIQLNCNSMLKKFHKKERRKS